MTRADIRRWIGDQRAAERRQRQELTRNPSSPADTIREALALVALFGRLHGWPAPEDGCVRRELAARIESWDRLRAALLPR
jgi:hypothetical protein